MTSQPAQAPAPGPLVAGFLRRAQSQQQATAVSQLLVHTWAAVDAELRGVIGPLGVSALLARSLKLAARQHPLLAVAHAQAGIAPSMAALQPGLAQLPLDQAVAASQALLASFEELLVELIGSALAERLLRPVLLQHTPGDAPGSHAQTP